LSKILGASGGHRGRGKSGHGPHSSLALDFDLPSDKEINVRYWVSYFTPKISDDLLLVIDQVFQILRVFTVLNVVYDPLCEEKPLFQQKRIP